MIRSCTLKQRQICVPVGLMSIGVGQRFSLEKAFTIQEKGFIIAKADRLNKAENLNICVFKLLIWRQKWVARIRQLALRSLSPGRKIVVSFTTKCAVPPQIKPRILELIIEAAKATLVLFSLFVSCEEKDYYWVVSVKQLGFDCRSYCGHSHFRRQVNHVFVVFFLFLSREV